MSATSAASKTQTDLRHHLPQTHAGLKVSLRRTASCEVHKVIPTLTRSVQSRDISLKPVNFKGGSSTTRPPFQPYLDQEWQKILLE